MHQFEVNPKLVDAVRLVHPTVFYPKLWDVYQLLLDNEYSFSAGGIVNRVKRVFGDDANAIIAVFEGSQNTISLFHNENALNRVIAGLKGKGFLLRHEEIDLWPIFLEAMKKGFDPEAFFDNFEDLDSEAYPHDSLRRYISLYTAQRSIERSRWN